MLGDDNPQNLPGKRRTPTLLHYKTFSISYCELVIDTGNETLIDCSAIFCINVMKVAHTGGKVRGRLAPTATNQSSDRLVLYATQV